ncbi:MAG: hypothetical protein R3C49_19730 [Planctomycetaceae bacterium]
MLNDSTKIRAAYERLRRINEDAEDPYFVYMDTAETEDSDMSLIVGFVLSHWALMQFFMPEAPND